jgi:hypothetical protein
MSRIQTWVAIATVASVLNSTPAWPGAPSTTQVAPQQTSAALDSNGTWRLISDPDTPPVFRIAVGAYDSRRDRMLVIEGGNIYGTVKVHSLDFASEHWSSISANGAPPNIKLLPSLIHDPVRDRLVLFGDSTVYALSLANPPTWHLLTTSGARPSARWGASAVLDSDRDQAIVFGGSALDAITGAAIYYSDAYAFSLTSNEWTPLAQSGVRPTGRALAGAIYDAGSDRMLMFGGGNVTGPLNDLWALDLRDSSSWTSLAPTGAPPTPRYGFGTAYDPIRNRMVVFGGFAVGGHRGDLWTLSLTDTPAWARVATLDSLEGRVYPLTIWDPGRDRIVVYGGSNNFHFWDQCASIPLIAPLRWTRFLPPSPPSVPGPRSGSAVVHDSRRDRILAIGGGYRPSDVPVWAFSGSDGGTWTPILASGWPTGGINGQAMYDSVTDRVLVFGIHSTWSLSFTPAPEWTEIDAAFPGGENARALLDPVRRRLIAYGGWRYLPLGNSYTLPDVWVLNLDGSPVWTRLGDGPVPQGSAGHSVFYDPVRDRMVVMGGYWSQGNWRENSLGSSIWSTPLDTLRWTALNSPGTQPPSGQTVYDSNRDRMLLFSDGAIHDVWSRPGAEEGVWTMLSPATTGPTIPSQVVYDPSNDRAVVLFTGPPATDTDQAWTLDFGSPRQPTVAGTLVLAPIVPNPARVSVLVEFVLPAPGIVDLMVFNVQGRRVHSVLNHAARPAGTNHATLRLEGLPTGFYFCRLEANGMIVTQKFLVLK